MRGAVAHGQDVIVAGNVAAAGKVIGALGEAGGHSIGSLQDAHRWLCDSLGKEGRRKIREVHEKHRGGQWQAQAEEKGER